MAFRRLLDTVVAATALGLAAMATPAAASDGPLMAQPAPYAPSAEQRDRWLDECSDRLSQSGGLDDYDYYGRRQRKEERAREHDRARASCERYYDSYYDYYSGHYRAWQPSAQPSYYQPRRAQNGPCDPSPDCRRGCGEVVEYEEVEVPVRAAPRSRPSKRIRIVPDKRIRLK